jgi:hypothetical protein
MPPGAGIVPLLKSIGNRRFRVVGTAFYITRYGLLLTARHVVEDLVPPGGDRLERAFVLEDSPEGRLVQRHVLGASISTTFDVAVIQVQNGMERTLARPGPMNLRARISLDVPPIGAELVTWAYPENAELDFSDSTRPPVLRADYYKGTFLENVPANARPFLPHPHYETNMEIRSGASGSPICYMGVVVGIASRSWTFASADETPLSSVLPISQMLALEVGCALYPQPSWEFDRIPENRRGAVLTFGELIAYGHVNPPPVRAG